MRHRTCLFACLFGLTGLALLLSGGGVSAQPDLQMLEALGKSTQAALDKIGPSVVQIRTIGGLDVIATGGKGPGLLKGMGPTTGVVVSPDGFIISSSFNFAHKPAAITVSIPGVKDPLDARVVATDQTRMLTLLKVEAKDLTVPAAIPKSEHAIGQWTLAVGRTWSEGNAPPSASVGVVSALNRIYGKAVQTDAKVSPVNYGGPLIDFQGRVFGILVPMTTRGEGEVAGVDWYDSGIGFAIPLEDVNRVLPVLKSGKNLEKGVLGVTFKNTDQFSMQPQVVGTVQSGSAAARAGIQPGDEIQEADGKPIRRQADLQHVLGNKYSIDKISLKIKRGDKTIDVNDIQLAGQSTAQVNSFLGIAPMRDDPELGVEVRHVFAKSPADQAGIKVGDRIMKIDGQAFSGRDQLLQRLATAGPGTKWKVEVQRKEGAKTDTVEVTLAEYSTEVPAADLPEGSLKKALEPRKPVGGKPPAKPPEKPAEKPKEVRTGFFVNKSDTTGHEYWVYVPENYDANISYALMVWFHPAGDSMEAGMRKLWGDIATKHRFIILAPKAENETGYITSETDAIKADIRDILAQYTVDRQRVVLHGMGNGGNLAFYLAFDMRDTVRGVATVGGALTNPAKPNVANQRCSFFMVAGARDPWIDAIRASHPRLTQQNLPVIYKEIPEQGNGYILDADLIKQLTRWIDSLDRL
jgi:S1-C subfamily serine protease/predicted esterase